MATVQVEMIGSFRKYINTKKLYLTLDEDSTFLDLMEELNKYCSDEFKAQVYDELLVSESLQKLIFVNNKNLFWDRGLNTVLKDGYKIMFLPPMSGG